MSKSYGNTLKSQKNKINSVVEILVDFHKSAEESEKEWENYPKLPWK